MPLRHYLAAAAAAAALATTAAALQDIPSLGLGTWLSDPAKVPHAVEFGLQHGYDLIDAAWIYRNEDQTGAGLAAAGRPRGDLWVTSKLWNTAHRPADVEPAARETLARLGLDRLDLYLMHWPVAFAPGTTDLDRTVTLLDTWRAMQALVRQNLTRHIGVSNFARADLELVLAECGDVCPYAHELETHPYLQQQGFLDLHRDRGVKVIAYSPLGNTNPTYSRRHGRLPPLLRDPFWVRLAEEKGVTPAQVVLAWGMRRGTTVIPKSTSEAHLLENVAAAAVNFTDAEMEAIAAQDKQARFLNPSKAWGVHLFGDLDDHEELFEMDDEL